MKKSKYMIIFLIIAFFSVIVGKLYFLNIKNHSYYEEKLQEKTRIYVLGSSAPRGRILDTNGKVLVDNKSVNTIIYNKIKGLTSKDEIEIAKKLASILTTEAGKIDELKDFWLLLNNNGKELITEEEYQLVQMRKLKKSDLEQLKKERITEAMLNELSDIEQKAAKIYNLMNKGYMYQKKEIVKNPSDEEYAKVMESNIPGITGEMTWERIYPYGDTIRSILGKANGIPKEKSDYFLAQGYELTDIVGVSYLESEYEEYLKGEKAKYQVNADNTLTLINSAQRGKDLVLSIDIDIQMKVDEIVKEKILLGKKSRNTEYYKESFAIVSDPQTGAIIAMSGQRYNDDETFSEITSSIIQSSYTMGSSVKGATIAVGYKNNLIDPNKKETDGCIKLNLVPAKCSHKRLGRIDDVKALAQSSNYYQHLIAISLIGKTYTPNMVLGATKEHFDIYRNTLKEFGLGALTGIDLPNEQTGIEGKTIADDLLLNLAIGQYDTYTPIEMIQYINTVASKQRMAPTLMKEIKEEDEVIVKQTTNILNELEIEDEDLERIRLGMEKVLSEGTGRGYTSQNIHAAGKTGTSESFYDSDNDGKVDVETISSIFTGYFPKEDPKYSVVVITPNISHKNGKDNTKYYGASKITRAITDYLFENH